MKNVMKPVNMSRTDFSRIFEVFFARMEPASNMANPNCIIITQTAAVIILSFHDDHANLKYYNHF